MYGRAAIAAVFLAGCFGPTLPGEVLCADGLCPDGFVCDDGFCRAMLSDAPDAAVDAPPDAAVDAAPVCATLTFRDNLADPDGYDDTDDTVLSEDLAGSTFGDEPTVEWDAKNDDTGGGEDHGLLRFDGVFGAGAGQVPAGAEIASATLSVVVTNDGSGDPGEVRETAVDWDETTTHDTFGDQPGVQADDLGERIDDAPTALGIATLDVSDSATRGSAAGQMPGWIFIPRAGNSSGVQMASSEAADEANRPTLEISFCD